jgi:hypothetical protein
MPNSGAGQLRYVNPFSLDDLKSFGKQSAANTNLSRSCGQLGGPFVALGLFWGMCPMMGLVSRVTPVHTAMRNCTSDEGGPFEVGNQVVISSHRKLLSSKAMVVNVAEKSERDFDRHD